jgi:hypothetical protein
MRKMLSALVLVASSLVLVGCSAAGTEVPDLAKTDEASASTFLLNQDLLPEIVYEYSDSIESGFVVKTEPGSGEVVSPGTKVKVFVSEGPRRVESKDSNLEWTYVGYAADDWNFSSPYIEDKMLVIETYDVKFGTALEWRKGDSSTTGFGRAAINDRFDKAVPISFEFEKKKVTAGEKQDFKILVPTSDLDNGQPTTLYLELYAKVGGSPRDVKINFTITW